jgi:uncharacterized protein (DUF1499 family)
MAERSAAGDPRQLDRRGARRGRIACLIVVVGIVTMVVAALGYRAGLVPLMLSLTALLPLGLLIAAFGTIFCLVLVIARLAARRQTGSGAGIGWPLAGLVLGAVAFIVPLSLILGARDAPQIHDITTDLDNPPAFVEAVAQRRATGASNPPEYVRLGGRPPNRIDVPAAQRRAYPDIKPVILPGVAPEDAFERARAAVDEMGWTLIAARQEDGRIEAYDQTFWFGFIDDVAIRVTPAGNGSRIDVRSLSRVGGGDAGTNAKRVRAYIAALKS